MNVGIYVRVSTQEQARHGISVEAQETACREWVKENGHRLAGVYNDAGLSARTRYKKRPALLRLLDDVQAGRVDLVIFTKLDRFFRSLPDYYEVQAILEAHGVKWRAIQEDYETETASGRFKVNIMLAVAQDEADRTSERLKAVMEHKRQKGEVVGKAPVGYKIQNKQLIIDPDQEPGMRAFWETYLTTHSRKGARIAAKENGLSMSDEVTGKALRNETYIGNYHGIPCPAYLTAEEWAQVQKIVSSRSRERTARRVYIFSGLFFCGYCGGPLTSAFVKKKSGEIHYYRCCNHVLYLDRCSNGTTVNEDKAEAWLLDNLGFLLSRYREAVEATRADAPDHTAEIKRLEGRLSRMKDLYIDGEISREDYNARTAAIKGDLDNLREQDRQAEPAPALELPGDWRENYAQLSDTGKKVFWSSVLGRVVWRKGEPPEVFF